MLDQNSVEKLAAELLCPHESAVLCHSYLVWTELQPVCEKNKQKTNQLELLFDVTFSYLTHGNNVFFFLESNAN